jgi:hypothetical protein
MVKVKEAEDEKLYGLSGLFSYDLETLLCYSEAVFVNFQIFSLLP